MPAANVFAFFELLAKFVGPRSILTHARGNDLGKLKSVILIRQMKKDISTLHESLPKGLITYSKRYSVTDILRWPFGRMRTEEQTELVIL